jgi:hypothetical protein
MEALTIFVCLFVAASAMLFLMRIAMRFLVIIGPFAFVIVAIVLLFTGGK